MEVRAHLPRCRRSWYLGAGALKAGRAGAARARKVQSVLHSQYVMGSVQVMCGVACRRGRSRAGGMQCGWEAESACARRGERRAGMHRFSLECCPSYDLRQQILHMLAIFVRAWRRISSSDIGCRVGCGAVRASASAQARCVAERSSSARRAAAQECRVCGVTHMSRVGVGSFSLVTHMVGGGGKLFALENKFKLSQYSNQQNSKHKRILPSLLPTGTPNRRAPLPTLFNTCIRCRCGWRQDLHMASSPQPQASAG